MKNFGYIILCILFSTCRTIELPMPDQTSPSGQPIFQLKGFFGNETKEWIVGKDNLVLVTDFEIKPYRVLALQGKIQNSTCNPTSTCTNSLGIVLRQSPVNNPSKVELGTRNFYKKTDERYSFKTSNRSVLSNSTTAKYSYVWTINGTKVSSEKEISLQELKLFKNTVCLQVTHPDGSNAAQCQTLDMEAHDSLSIFKVSLRVLQKDNKAWYLMPELVGGIKPYKITWDNKTSGDLSEIDSKSESNRCITVVDSLGRVASACIDLNPSAKIKCEADFIPVIDQASLKEITQYNSVEILYVDAAGKQWNSFSNGQPAGSFFEISEAKEFDLNNKQQPTRRIKIKFQSTLFNGNENRPFFMDGYFGVAVPR